MIALLLCVAPPAGQASATETDPAPQPSPISTPDTPTPIAAPVIQSPGAGTLVGDTIPFAGTAEPGSGIDLFRDSGGQPLCSVVASDSGEWACSVRLDSASSVTVRAVQSIGAQSTETSVQFSVLNAPTAGPAGGGSVSSGTVMGSAFPGATVTAVVGGVSCQVTADASGGWFCMLPKRLASGSYSLTASQIAPWSEGRSSASSEPRTLVVDVDAPSPPSVAVSATNPVPVSGAVFSGDGEDGATVTVFAGPHTLCQAVVASGRWSCTAAELPPGSYEVSAIQQDVAGNISDESTRVVVAFGAAATPNAGSTPTPTAVPTTQQPSPTSTTSPPLPESGDSGAVAPGDPGATAQAAPGAPGAVAPGGWSAATRFSAAMQPVFGRAGSIDWTLAFGIGLAMVALLAVPARLLAGTLKGLRLGGGAEASRTSRFTGRNRSRYQEYESAPELPWGGRTTGAFALFATAAITVLSAPVNNEPAYLRLLVAAAFGILVVNAAAVLVPRLLARWILDVSVDTRLRPAYLLISVAAMLISRAFDLDPALVFGVAFGVVLAGQVSRRARGRVATMQIGVLLVVGTTALLVSGSIPALQDTLGSFLAEFVNTVALSSLGGAAILLLPIADLPGRRILQWRPLVWLALAVVGFTLLGGILSSALENLGGGAGIILLALASLAFAAACIATWIWARFVRSPAEASNQPANANDAAST